MASVKLNEQLRRDIVRELLTQGGFYKVEEAKKQAYIKACHTLYYNVFKSYLASFAFINKRFFNYSNSFDIKFDTDDINKGIAKSIVTGYRTISVYVPNGYPSPLHNMTLEELGIMEQNADLQHLLAVRREWNDATLKIKEATYKAYQVLNNVNTTNQLIKVWADVEPILAKLLPKQVAKYPIGESITDLNELFGLKKESK